MYERMNVNRPFGLYLIKKTSTERPALKDLLQFLRTVSPAQGHSFSYIEAHNSLHPHLSLWENLQLEAGQSSWREFQTCLNLDQHALLKLLKNPEKKVADSEIWEKLLVSLLKGLINQSKNLLIDMNEDLVSPLLIQNLKKTVLTAAGTKTVYLASANTSLWLDCAHSLVDRKQYEFIVQALDSEVIKKNWSA